MMSSNKFILYAPNVHKGGGATLLESLLSEVPRQFDVVFFIDVRFRSRLPQDFSNNIIWVKPTLSSRLAAEITLFFKLKSEDVLFCFGGIPPLFAVCEKLIIFQQNRNLLGLSSLKIFDLKTQIRLGLERVVCRLFNYKVAFYIVQTESMSREVSCWSRGANIKIAPFRAKFINVKNNSSQKKWDYIYISDGTGHKNHGNLLEAWRLLSLEGIRPSLGLTVGDEHQNLISQIHDLNANYGLKIENLGHIPHVDMQLIYTQARALIYPSISESFGLPLVEASELGVPILASELDYVRDVCNPVHTFDPSSATSIARAVKRDQGIFQKHITPLSPGEFWSLLVTSTFG